MPHNFEMCDLSIDHIIGLQNVMGNHRLHPLALNTMTWASLCWAAVLHPDALASAVKSNHFLNYVTQEAQELRATGTAAEQTRHYILVRATVFFRHLLAECIETNVDGLLYLTESLLAVWRKSRVEELEGSIDLSQPQANVVAYENQLQQIFTSVWKSYHESRTLYQQAALRNCKYRLLSSIQAHNTKNYVTTPLLSLQQLVDWHATEGQHSPLLETFLRVLPTLDLLPKIPRLVTMYNSLNRLFGFRLTKTQARKPVLECLKMIMHLEPAETINAFRDQWASFREDWEAIRHAVGELNPVCNAQVSFYH